MLVASVDEKNPLRLADFEERQRLKAFEDRLIDIILIFDATCDTITSLLDRYQEFRIGCDSTWGGGDRMQPDFIVCAFQERQKDIHSSRNKVKTLHKKVQGTTNLVSKCFLESQVSCSLTYVFPAIESAGPWKRILPQTACGGSQEGKYHNAATHRKKHKRCCSSQGAYHSYVDLPSCDGRISEYLPGLHGFPYANAHEMLEFFFNTIR